MKFTNIDWRGQHLGVVPALIADTSRRVRGQIWGRNLSIPVGDGLTDSNTQTKTYFVEALGRRYICLNN